MEIVEFWYREYVKNEVLPYFDKAELLDIARRISELTLREPIWMNRSKDYNELFPELVGYVNVPLTGLYLVAILKEIVGGFGTD